LDVMGGFGISDRGDLKIKEEEFVRPPIQVNIHISIFQF